MFKKNIHYLIIPIILFIFAQIIFQTHFWHFLEYKAYDTLFRIRGVKQTTEQIVIIAIDDDSFSSLDMRWPFPRELYARMINNLNRAGAKQIVFDISFTETSYLDDDEALIKAAEEFENVIFAGKMVHDHRTRYDITQLIKPIPPIRERNFNWGLVNISPDIDGFIRRYTLFEEYGHLFYYPIGIVSLANLYQYDYYWKSKIHLEAGFINLHDCKIPKIYGNRALIQYYGPPKTFQHFSFSSVIDDSDYLLPGIETEDFQINEFYYLLDREVFKDKIVLIGATVDELHDVFQTPFTSQRLMPGVEIHANFIEMVLQNDFLETFSPFYMFFIVLLVALLCYFIFTNMKPVISLFFSLLFIFAYLFLAFSYFTNSNLVLALLPIPFIIIVTYLGSLVYHYIKASRERKFIKKTFMHFMAPELVNELLKNPKMLKYGGAQQEITVLFSDIRDFTNYSEKHSPQDTVTILQEYLTEMVEIIIKNRGIVDKFVGDEIMALYGTPVKLENSALAACKSAVQMRLRMNELCKKWEKEGKDIFEIGIGINTGPAVVGNLGSQQIFDYTAIGDTINLCARLENLNKEYETQTKIIISEYTLQHVEKFVDVRFIDEVKVKGKDIAVKIYELVNIKVTPIT
ncbi:MAG: adenylate/guanylate cyclase domain-containing protein [Candidatus Cloacimonetes bacterium]|nr:adenylate/guanylate cyclase domain-containing protein [Candidatus Cloacimonadota bacterium]